jgi:hypothetical protein
MRIFRNLSLHPGISTLHFLMNTCSATIICITLLHIKYVLSPAEPEFIYQMMGQAGQVDYENDYSPAWRFVVQYMRWKPKLKALANTYLRRTIGEEPTPPVSLLNNPRLLQLLTSILGNSTSAST